MITILLEKIITILEGWIQSFASHAQHVEDKLDSLDQTASDIETNTEPISDIADNTGAVVTPIQNIKSNTDSIKQSSQTSANNTTAILNNISTLSTNTGRAAAFAEDCANNTLDIKDKVTTIASDTTQIRADNANIAADVSSINQAIGYYVANTLVTEESEGALCNIDTDLEDYLQKLKVNIPADLTGFSGITITKCGKNLGYFNSSNNYENYNSNITYYSNSHIKLENTGAFARNGFVFDVEVGKTYTISFSAKYDSNYKRLYVGHTTPATAVGNYYTIIYSTDSWADYSYTFTATTNKLYLLFYYTTTTDPSTCEVKNLQIEVNDTATTYEPYKAMTYPVSFGSTITDGAEADLLSGLVTVNTTPASFIQIQPIAVRTYKGVNNIYSDIGTSALTYRETLKHYLDKNNQ